MNVLVALGGVRGLIPNVKNQLEKEASLSLSDICSGGRERTVKVREEWTLQDVMAESLFYNQHIGGRWGARVLEAADSTVLRRTHHRGDATLLRVSRERREAAEGVLATFTAMASKGLTHISDLIKGKEQGQIRFMTHAELPRSRREAIISTDSYARLLQGIPSEWRDAIDRANRKRRDDPGRGWAELEETPDESYAVSPSGKWIRQMRGETPGRTLWAITPAKRLRHWGNTEGTQVPDGATWEANWKQATVWKEQRNGHCAAERDDMERRAGTEREKEKDRATPWFSGEKG